MAVYEDDREAVVESEGMNTSTTSTVSEFSVRSVWVLTASFFSLFCTAGLVNAFGVFQTYYTAHYLQKYSDFQISWIGSFAVFMLFGFGTPVGILSDRFGPTLPLSIGAVCQLVAVMMVSLCKEYYQFFLAQGLLLGFSMSCLSIPTTSVTPLYFQRNRGLAQGISIAGSSLGGVLWPVVLNELLNHDGTSFGWSIRAIGFIQIPLLAVVVLAIRPPPTPKTASVDSRETFHARSASEDEKGAKLKQRRNELATLRHPSFVFLCLGLAIFYFGFFAPFFFVSSYALSLGMSQSFSIYLISILNAASLFGRILPGFIADRVGHFNIMTVAMFGSSIVGFCWTTASGTAGLVIWSLVYGFVSGAVLSLQFACTSLVATKETMGVAIGIMMSSIALTALFGSPIAGELVQRGYLALSMFAGATMLAGGVLVLAARLARNRNLLAKA